MFSDADAVGGGVELARCTVRGDGGGGGLAGGGDGDVGGGGGGGGGNRVRPSGGGIYKPHTGPVGLLRRCVRCARVRYIGVQSEDIDRHSAVARRADDIRRGRRGSRSMREVLQCTRLVYIGPCAI